MNNSNNKSEDVLINEITLMLLLAAIYLYIMIVLFSKICHHLNYNDYMQLESGHDEYNELTNKTTVIASNVSSPTRSTEAIQRNHEETENSSCILSPNNSISPTLKNNNTCNPDSQLSNSRFIDFREKEKNNIKVSRY